MWRGGGRIGLSGAAPFVWRCLISRAIAPFPHPAHRTGRALLTHPALGQDITPSRTEGHEQPPDQPPGPWDPGVLPSARLLATASATSCGDSSSLEQRPGSPFASACEAFHSSRTSTEFNRVAPISRALPLPAPALNQGPFPPPALPGLLGNTGLSATPWRPVQPSPAPGWSSRPITKSGFPCCARSPPVYMPSPLPRHGDWVLSPLASPALPAFPAWVDGSARATSFSRPAQRSLTLRPAHAPSHHM